MKPAGRGRPLVLLGGSLLLLVSLYLPWGRMTATGRGIVLPPIGLRTLDGWSTSIGPATGLAAVALAAIALAACALPELAGRLPVGRLALLAGYLGVATAVVTHAFIHENDPRLRITVQLAYGSYLGLVGAGLVVVSAAVLRRQELALDRSLRRLVALALAGALLVVLLLPWWTLGAGFGAHLSAPGVTERAAVVVAAFVALFVGVDRASRSERIALAGATLVTTLAVVGRPDPGVSGTSMLWLGAALAVALLVVVLTDGALPARSVRPPWLVVAAGAASALVVGSLFLPWQRTCFTAGQVGKAFAGCSTASGWSTTPGAAAGALALLLVAIAWAPRLALRAPELAAALAVLVATVGVQFDRFGSLASGAYVGFAGTALLLVLVAVRLRPAIPEPGRVFPLLAPLALCAAYLAVVVVPWWEGIPPEHAQWLFFVPLSWLTVAGMVLGILLTGLWLRRLGDGSTDGLVLIPLFLLALAALDLIRARHAQPSWGGGGGAIVVICVLLALAGRAEQGEGLHVPDVLRVDRV